MLINQSGDPLALGEYVLQLLASTDWIRRRVETVRFLDDSTLQRRVTLDLSITVIDQLLADSRQHADPSLLFVDPDARPVPLTMLKKTLLSDFDLRDRSNAALPVATRDEDVYFAWCAMLAQTARHGIPLDPTGPVAGRLREVIYNFPDPADEPDNTVLRSWKAPGMWDDDARATWTTLRRNSDLSGLLRDLTFNFLLIAVVPTQPTPEIVKFTYREGFSFRSPLLGLTPSRVEVRAPAVGWPRSYHLRFRAPEGLHVTGAKLLPARDLAPSQPISPAAPSAMEDTPKEAEMYHTKLSGTQAHVYTHGIERADYFVDLELRPPVQGFFRAATASCLFTAVVVTVAAFLRARLQRVGSGAAVTLLLAVPPLVSAYLVRPGEHALLSRILRPSRYLTASSALVSYVAAAALVLFKARQLPWSLSLLAILAWVPVIGVGAVSIFASQDLRSAASDMDRTIERSIREDSAERSKGR